MTDLLELKAELGLILSGRHIGPPKICQQNTLGDQSLVTASEVEMLPVRAAVMRVLHCIW